jgi:hypothetical protein
MSSVVHDLQKAIVEGKESLTQLLRKTKLIAAKLTVEDVAKWADCELKGYPETEKLPDYRQFLSQHVEVRNPIRGWAFAGSLERVFRAPQPIAEIENLAGNELCFISPRENFPTKDSFASDWPQRIAIPGSEFKKILEAVRNELLEWTIKLENRGIKGESMSFNEDEKRLATNVHIEKFAGVFGNVTNSQVAVNDYSSIAKLLIDQNVPTKERRELEDILEELKTASLEKKKGLIAKAEGWMVKHAETLGTGAEIVGKFIKGLSGHDSSTHPH